MKSKQIKSINMGCDIHGFIELKMSNGNWTPVVQKVNLERDYVFFANLAGVRNYNNTVPVCGGRRMPKDVSYACYDEYYLFISDEKEPGYCSKSNAERWVKNGISFYKHDNENYISGPDYHSASYCNASELAQVISKTSHVYTKYKAVLAMMEFIDSAGGESRFVFWFDN